MFPKYAMYLKSVNLSFIKVIWSCESIRSAYVDKIWYIGSKFNKHCILVLWIKCLIPLSLQIQCTCVVWQNAFTTAAYAHTKFYLTYVDELKPRQPASTLLRMDCVLVGQKELQRWWLKHRSKEVSCVVSNADALTTHTCLKFLHDLSLSAITPLHNVYLTKKFKLQKYLITKYTWGYCGAHIITYINKPGITKA